MKTTLHSFFACSRLGLWVLMPVLFLFACKKKTEAPAAPAPVVIKGCTDGTRVAHYYPGSMDFYQLWTFLYNAKGQLSEMPGYKKFEYSAAGKIAKIIEYNGKGVVTVTTVFSFDSLNRITGYAGTNRTGVGEIATYTYNGSITRVVNLYMSPYLKHVREFEFDAKGNEIKETVLDTMDNIIGITQMSYDNMPAPAIMGLVEPYLTSNNNLSTLKIIDPATLAPTRIDTYGYTYNKQGYPVDVKFSSTGSLDSDPRYKLDYYCE